MKAPEPAPHPVLRARAAAALLGLALVVSPLAAAQGATEIVFTYGADDTGTVRTLIDGFNAAHAGDVHVTWREMARESDAYHRDLVRELASGDGGIHVIAADVIWTAELAKAGLVGDLTKRFYEELEPASMIDPALESATWRLRRWGVPWYTDASMLFYRKDLLARSGFDAPPETWDQLKTMARKVMDDSGTRYGFVFQGADYEGGTANALEFIWSAGGRVVTTTLRSGAFGQRVTETQSVRIDSEEAARGLDIARSMVAGGITPADVTTFREREALDAFVAGDAVFLRSWPYVHGVLRRSGDLAKRVGVAAIPSAKAGGTGSSCLGGWNLMIAARAGEAEREAAWKLIRYLTDPAQQKRQAREGGLLPVLRALYDDAELRAAVPVLALSRTIVASRLRVRPVSPFYTRMSAHIARAFSRTLRGELTGAQAVKALDGELRAITRRNR